MTRYTSRKLTLNVQIESLPGSQRCTAEIFRTLLYVMATNMDNEMNEWLEDSASQKIAIWCEDPEIHHEKIAGRYLNESVTR